MATPHINAKDGAFAKVVLMPGDPKRAKWIADTYLHDVEEVTNVRGILGFTGFTKNNARVSVMASGMGIPSIGIYSYELYTHYNVETIIRVGTCGSYQKDIGLFDIILGQCASTDSNWCSQFNVGTYSAGADFEVLKESYEAAKRHNIPVHVGNILSADVFYDEDPDTWKRWARLGVLGVEMESYGLYVNAAKLHKRAMCLLTVTDSFILPDKATTEQRQLGLGKMIEVALEAAEKFA